MFFDKQSINTLYWTVFQSCVVHCKKVIYGSISSTKLCTFHNISEILQIIKFRNNLETIYQLVNFNLSKGITDHTLRFIIGISRDRLVYLKTLLTRDRLLKRQEYHEKPKPVRMVPFFLRG